MACINWASMERDFVMIMSCLNIKHIFNGIKWMYSLLLMETMLDLSTMMDITIINTGLPTDGSSRGAWMGGSSILGTSGKS